MSWMKYGTYRSQSDPLTQIEQYDVATSSVGKVSLLLKKTSSVYGKKDGKAKGKLSTPEDDRHPRRTLDQFYYPALEDTSERDKDQTVSKWSGKQLPKDGRIQADDQSSMLMVDQLWCWVLDESTCALSV